MKKVLIITYYWPPGSGAGVQRWVKLSKYLAELGVETHVLTVRAEQASYPLRDQSLLNEVGEKVIVHTCETREWFSAYAKISKGGSIPFAGFAGEAKPSALQKLSRFIRGNFFIPDPRKGWNQYALREAEGLIRKHGIQTVITTSPPHSTQLVGLALKKKLNVCWIADLRDPWTDIYYYKQFYHLPLAAAIDSRYERRVLENADRIVVVSRDMKRLFLGKSSKIEPSRVNVLPNGFDESDFNQHSTETQQGEFSIVYTGTLTAAYPLEALVTILRESVSKHPLKLEFTGSVSHHALEPLKAILGDKLSLRGHVSHAQAVETMMNAGILLLLIPRTNDNKGILTGKIFEYLRSGKPILGIGPADGDAAAILSETGAGKMFDPDDKDGIKGFVQQTLSGQLPPRNIKAIEAYSRSEQAKQWQHWIL